MTDFLGKEWEFEGLETGERLEVRLTGQVLAGYRRRVSQFAAERLLNRQQC